MQAKTRGDVSAPQFNIKPVETCSGMSCQATPIFLVFNITKNLY